MGLDLLLGDFDIFGQSLNIRLLIKVTVVLTSHFKNGIFFTRRRHNIRVRRLLNALNRRAFWPHHQPDHFVGDAYLESVVRVNC